MPITYNLFSITKFPDAPETGTVVFSRTDEELRGTPATLVVEYMGADESLELEHYKSIHELHRRIAGRTYTGEVFDSFYQQNETKLSIHRESNSCYCRSGRRAAKGLIDRLNAEYPITVRFEYVELDFEKIRPRVDELNGIWVAGISEPNIDTVALFGLNVDQSSVYEALKSVGSASSILLPFESSAGRYPVILSARGSVTFVQPLPEEQCLSLLFEMRARLFGHALRIVESKQSAKERRQREREAEAALNKARKKPKRKKR